MDAASQAAALNNMLGPTQGSNGPSSWLLSLWEGDPSAGGTEASSSSCPGYARVSVAKADWSEASSSDPVKRTTDLVQFGDATDAWEPTLTHWALIHPTSGDLGPSAELGEELDVTAAGPGPAVMPEIYFDESTEES